MDANQESKLCPVCGAKVPPSKGRHVYCSEACKRAAVLEQNRQSCAKHRALAKAGTRWDAPLNAPRLCPGGPWNHHKCGHKAAYESRWCEKCQQARRKYYGLGWSSDDPAQGFAGGEVEHEVAI